MKTVAAIPAVFLAACLFWAAGDAHQDKIPGGVHHPTKPGTYVMGEWTYVYGIASKGTRSEKRMGSLFLRGFPVQGVFGKVTESPFGKFLYWKSAYSSGWMNTLTYDRPVFDSERKLLPEIKKEIKEYKKKNSNRQKAKGQTRETE